MSKLVRPILSMACALGLSVALAGCGGGSGSREAYCNELQQDWDTLNQASTLVFNVSLSEFPSPDPDSIRKKLSPYTDLLTKASGLAADLAKIAPTLLNTPLGMTAPPTPRKTFELMSAALADAGQGTIQLNEANPYFDSDNTGCTFDDDGPDGTVAVDAWP